MAGLLKKIVRAAVAQPWEYMGRGAPQEWEFRVSYDEGVCAVYSPDKGTWLIFRDVVVIAEVTSQDEMDRETGSWARFVEELDDE